MKKIILLSILLTLSLMASSQSKILLTVGETTKTATLVDNAATRELKALLERGPITIRMNDYGGFEKVGALPQSFTTSNSQITTEPGDIMLYQGNNIVIFYGSNSWSYTRLGKIDGASADEVKQFLGNGEITLTISLDLSTGNDVIPTVVDRHDSVYDLKGNAINSKPLSPGVYIINGKKICIGK